MEEGAEAVALVLLLVIGCKNESWWKIVLKKIYTYIFIYCYLPYSFKIFGAEVLTESSFNELKSY